MEETKKTKGKIRLASMYPYTFVRVNVMRTKLLSRHDYDKLLKMSFPEIAKFLQDTDYKSEIDEMAMKATGVELLELALNKNLAKTFRKLRKISPDELNLLIEAYLTKYDLINVKALIRGVYTKATKEQIKKLLVSAGSFDDEKLSELLKKDSIDELLKNIPFVNYSEMQKFVEALKDKGELFELENALDKQYYNYILKFAERIAGEGQLFKKFLFSQIETTNILTTVRLMKEGMEKDDIKNFIFWTGIKEHDDIVNKFLNSKHIENVLEHITNNATRKYFEKSINTYKESKSLVEFERQLSKSMLERAVLFVHQNPLSVNTILGYMFAKELETHNLIKIVKGKELGLDEKFLEAELVA